MKILWHSNAPWAPTGYGQQTRLFTPRLAAHHDITISSFYGLQGDRLNWEGIQVLPGLGNEYGNDYLIKSAQRVFDGDVRGGLVLSLMDVWVLHPDMCSQLDLAAWCPIDHEPAPPAVTTFFRNSGAIPIAMSRFGQRQLEEFAADYVPHAVDLEIFKPYDQAEVRDQLGAEPDRFLVGVVAANKGANPSRKNFVEAMRAFKIFQERHEEAILYLHTDMGGDEDLVGIKESLQIPDDAFRMADQYRINLQPLPAPLMARLYSTFSCLLNPAAGEGFGVPVLEAGACGVPSIVTDFSAMPEVGGPAAWKVACSPRWTPQRSWQANPDVESIVEALEECYNLSPHERAARGRLAVEHAKQYEVDHVLTEHFLPAIDRVTERLADRAPAPLKAAA